MVFYLRILFFIILLGFIIKDKKWYMIITFSILFLISALRKYTIGIDLRLHYYNYFIKFSQWSWSQLFHYYKYSVTYYDLGLIIFMKLLSYISSIPQFFQISTSAIINFGVGRYIYKNSKMPKLHTILYFTSFMYVMSFNIIAQFLAISVVLLGINLLFERKYIKFGLVVLISSIVHSSSLINLLLIPIFMLKPNKNTLFKFIIGNVILIIAMDSIVPFVIKYIFPQFSMYFSTNIVSSSARVQLMFGFVYLAFFIVSYLLVFYFPKLSKNSININKFKNDDKSIDNKNENLSEIDNSNNSIVNNTKYMKKKKDKSHKKSKNKNNNSMIPVKMNTTSYLTNDESNVISQKNVITKYSNLNSKIVFLFNMTLIAFTCRYLATKNYIFSRVGFYFYIYVFTLFTNTLSPYMKTKFGKRIEIIVTIAMILFFVLNRVHLEYSYGVDPYMFFWQ